MKFWTRLRWFAALAFLALLLWSCWASDEGRPAREATESSPPGISNF
jgi:hypothetical protein